MREMTAEEQAREVIELKKTGLWPFKVILPVKKRVENSFPRTGVIYLKDGQLPGPRADIEPTVYEDLDVFRAAEEGIMPEEAAVLNGVTLRRFDSVEAMVASGWIID